MTKSRATIAPFGKRTRCAESRGTTSWDSPSACGTGADQRHNHHKRNAKYPDRMCTCGGNNGRGGSPPSPGPIVMPSTVSSLVAAARALLFGQKISHHHADRRRHPMAAGVLRDHSMISIRSEKAGQYIQIIWACASSSLLLSIIGKKCVCTSSVLRCEQFSAWVSG